VARPKVLLLDEPLSNLDARLREELRGELAALRARLKTTMIFVTHDQSEALALADRVAVMNGGVVEQLDTPQALYQRPATPFVAGFVGGATLLTGEAKDGHFHVGPVALPLPDSLAASGAGTLVLRPEDVRVFQGGPSLPLAARLFVGSAAEYRFQVGDAVLRALGAPDAPGAAGDAVPVSLERALFFPAKLV
jgi:iron(III) transport system ATP-binding protein